MERGIGLQRFICMEETRSNNNRRTVLATIARRLRAFYLFVQTNFQKDAEQLFRHAEAEANSRDLVAVKGISRMPQNPNCPKCGPPITLRRTTRAPHPADDRYVFECPHGKVTYATKDHIPAAGPRDN